MLRLLLAASLGAELLESTGPRLPGGDAILRTVAHAARVLGRFSGWLRNGRTRTSSGRATQAAATGYLAGIVRPLAGGGRRVRPLRPSPSG